MTFDLCTTPAKRPWYRWRHEYLVVGATGLQGGATVDALLASGRAVRAMTRNPSSPSSQTLAARGVSVAAGDLDEAASLTRALDGVAGAYLGRGQG
jgi:uncharacterized protein YbjT (DUF2867 family)